MKNKYKVISELRRIKNLTSQNFIEIVTEENLYLWELWFNKKGNRAKEYRKWSINTINILTELNCNLLSFEISDIVCDISKIYKNL